MLHAKLDALIRANSPALPLIVETIEAAYKHGGRTTIVYLNRPDTLPVFDGPGSPRIRGTARSD